MSPASTQFGVNLTRLKPGAASALRHWHEPEDEFIYVLEGELVLFENDGETVLRPGDARASRPASPNGHLLVNRSQRDAVYLEIGTRAATERAHYPDVDCVMERDERGMRFLHRSGEPYPQERLSHEHTSISSSTSTPTASRSSPGMRPGAR